MTANPAEAAAQDPTTSAKPDARTSSFRQEVDLRRAINAISDVVQNRPRPLRDFDQIHMKAGDMVLQSEFVGELFADYCLELALTQILAQPGFDPVEAFHQACRKYWPHAGSSIFMRSSLRTLSRKGRDFLEQERNDAAHAAATLWYVLKYHANPTGHDLLEVVTAWQSKNIAHRWLLGQSS